MALSNFAVRVDSNGRPLRDIIEMGKLLCARVLTGEDGEEYIVVTDEWGNFSCPPPGGKLEISGS